MTIHLFMKFEENIFNGMDRRAYAARKSLISARPSALTIHMYKKFDEKISNGVDRRAYTVRNGRTDRQTDRRTDGRAAFPSPPPSRRGTKRGTFLRCIQKRGILARFSDFYRLLSEFLGVFCLQPTWVWWNNGSFCINMLKIGENLKKKIFFFWNFFFEYFFWGAEGRPRAPKRGRGAACPSILT